MKINAFPKDEKPLEKHCPQIGKLIVYAETPDEADFLGYVTSCIQSWIANRVKFDEKDNENGSR